MSEIGVIYWSGSGNTKAMAEAVAEGIKSAGAETDLMEVSDISQDKAAEYEKLAFGCPSMGSEMLEESEFEPFFEAVEQKLSGKKVALFGSYGWGDGEWMRDWQDRVESKGAVLFKEGLILNETPDSDGLEECKEFGKSFAQF
ncbi:flavodoxin [Proteocatella sphenisci]|uniref:flavodoxin n=1 Tax=Proteocatella sphenisci TaxID=181070 RepID=UPI00048AAF21|nr:flavodoxin [Proteocatella sphenisci]